MRTFTMSLTSTDHGSANPAQMNFTMGDAELPGLVVARLCAFVSSLVAGCMTSTTITGVQMRTDGVIGITDVPFPTASYAIVQGWAEPVPPAPLMANPPNLLSYGLITGVSASAPLGTSALITERVSEFDENGNNVGPGNNGRVFLPFLSVNAFTNGIINANATASIKKAYEWYVLAEGNPVIAEQQPSRPFIRGRVPGSPPATPLVYRQVNAVSVRARAAHLRSRTR